MGLFKQRRDEGAATADAAAELSPAEAVVGIAVAAVYSDGVIDQAEYDVLDVYLGRLGILRELGHDGLADALARMQHRANDLGDDQLVAEAAAALPERLRATAFAAAAEIVAGDGRQEAEENRFLRDLRERLALDDATAERVLDVVRIMHAT